MAGDLSNLVADIRRLEEDGQNIVFRVENGKVAVVEGRVWQFFASIGCAIGMKKYKLSTIKAVIQRQLQIATKEDSNAIYLAMEHSANYKYSRSNDERLENVFKAALFPHAKHSMNFSFAEKLLGIRLDKDRIIHRSSFEENIRPHIVETMTQMYRQLSELTGRRKEKFGESCTGNLARGARSSIKHQMDICIEAVRQATDDKRLEAVSNLMFVLQQAQMLLKANSRNTRSAEKAKRVEFLLMLQAFLDKAELAKGIKVDSKELEKAIERAMQDPQAITKKELEQLKNAIVAQLQGLKWDQHIQKDLRAAKPYGLLLNECEEALSQLR